MKWVWIFLNKKKVLVIMGSKCDENNTIIYYGGWRWALLAQCKKTASAVYHTIAVQMQETAKAVNIFSTGSRRFTLINQDVILIFFERRPKVATPKSNPFFLDNIP